MVFRGWFVLVDRVANVVLAMDAMEFRWLSAREVFVDGGSLVRPQSIHW